VNSYYRTGSNTGFSLGFFGTLLFGPFLLMGWLFTLPLRLLLPRRRAEVVLIVERRDR
jgi:hypothetical protein